MAERKEAEELDKLLQENCDEVIVEFKRPRNKGMPRFRVDIIFCFKRSSDAKINL